MKKVVVFVGGAGYIGSHTAYLLNQRGYNVVVIDSFVHKQPSVVTWGPVFFVDIGNVNALDELFSKYHVLGVMDFAAFIEIGESVKHPSRFYDNNVAKMLKLLDVMLHHNIKNIVFSSSCAVYGVPQEVPISEKHPRNPINTYGKNKLCMEFALEDYAYAYGLNHAILRYFNAAGALPEQGLGEMHNPESHVIPLLLRSLENEEAFSVFGTRYDTRDGTCIRDYIHVLDLASAHVKAFEYLIQEKKSLTLNLGSGKGYSVRELIRAAETVVGKDAILNVAEAREGDVPVLLADNTKACKMLNWELAYSSLSNIVKSAYVWEKKRFELEAPSHFASI